MKLKKVISIFACSFLLAGGALLAAQNAPSYLEAKADTDIGEITFTTTRNESGGQWIYFQATTTNAMPQNWSDEYYPVGDAGGVFLDGVDLGAIQLLKVPELGGDYIYALNLAEHALSAGDAGATLKITGSWSGNGYSFSIADYYRRWTGSKWDYALEEYDVISLMDAGIADFESETINTEYGLDRDSLHRNGFGLNNDTQSFIFQFEFEAFGDMTETLTIRIGNTSWGLGHGIKLNINNHDGDYSYMNIIEEKADAVVQQSGWIQGNDLSAGSSHIIEFGAVKILNDSDYFVMVNYDGVTKYSAKWAIDSAVRYNRVAMYYGGNNIAVRNTISQEIGTEELIFDSCNADGISFHTTNDLIPGHSSWERYATPYVVSNVQYNGANIAAGKINYFKKTSETGFYFGLTSDLKIAPVKGDILTIGGEFRIVFETDCIKKFSLAFVSYRFNGTTYERVYNPLDSLTPSSADQLEAGNLLSNIGRTNPSDRKKTSVKNFDQQVVWDNDLGEEVDTLVYKKDKNDHTGIYFTNNNKDTHGEFRVYFPGNGYKTESKGYAMTQLTFDYILLDSDITSKTGRNHTIDSDGYYHASTGDKTTKFTLQAMVKYAKDGNMYHDYDIELVNDGQLHSVTFNLKYCEVFGFAFVLWNFDGTFFMSNVHADYLDYNASLESFVGTKLQMYTLTNNSENCANNYAAAKAAYNLLDAADKALFNTHAAYGSARARLSAWATANGETFDAVNGTLGATRINPIINSENNSVVIIALIASIITFTSVAGVVILRKKHQK